MYSPINCTIILGGFNDWIIESIMENAHESNEYDIEGRFSVGTVAWL